MVAETRGYLPDLLAELRKFFRCEQAAGVDRHDLEEGSGASGVVKELLHLMVAPLNEFIKVQIALMTACLSLQANAADFLQDLLAIALQKDRVQVPEMFPVAFLDVTHGLCSDFSHLQMNVFCDCYL